MWGSGPGQRQQMSLLLIEGDEPVVIPVNDILCRSWLRTVLVCAQDGADNGPGYALLYYTVESSAYMYMAICDETESGRSLINNQYSDGPRTEPCRTPALTRPMAEE